MWVWEKMQADDKTLLILIIPWWRRGQMFKYFPIFHDALWQTLRSLFRLYSRMHWNNSLHTRIEQTTTTHVCVNHPKYVHIRKWPFLLFIVHFQLPVKIRFELHMQFEHKISHRRLSLCVCSAFARFWWQTSSLNCLNTRKQ